MIRRQGMLLCVLMLLGCPDGADDRTGGSSGGGKPEPSSPFGRFEGEVVAVWDDDGRNMTLREDFAYIDPGNRRWEAKANSIVNGASIPQPFWSVIGGPFEGRFRNASVVHDVACEQMTETWRAVHRMFHDACRCGGVGETKAKLMYWAVYNFGPRWNILTETRTRERPDGTTEEYTVEVAHPIMMAASIDDQLAQQAEAYFETHDVSLVDVESLSVSEIRQGAAGGPLPVPPE